MIAHLVYFETLASINDETTPAWKSTVAGLVVLRLIDDWLDVGAQIVTTDVTGLRAIRESIAAVSEGDPIRSILNGAVDTLEHAETASVRAIAPNLMAYGRALHHIGKWALAKDVFTTLLRRAQETEDLETVTTSALRLGFVTRSMGELADAEAAYMLAEESAYQSSNLEGQLRARLGIAQVTIARGNLPQADELLNAVVDDAQKHQQSNVLADALHDRAHLCHLREDYSSAVRYAYAALEWAPDLMVRDRILGDLAASFAELGYLDAARDAHLIVVATAQESWLRNLALINLLEIAIKQSEQLAFQSYRRQLADTILPPYMQAYYHLYSSQGYRTFGDIPNAEQELQRAAAVADEHRLNQVHILVDKEQEQQRVEPVKPVATKEWSPELKTIATAIGNMRQLAETAYSTGTAF